LFPFASMLTLLQERLFQLSFHIEVRLLSRSITKKPHNYANHLSQKLD